MRWFLCATLLALGGSAGVLGCATGQGENGLDDAAVPTDGPRVPDAVPIDAAPDAMVPCVEGDLNFTDPGTGQCYMFFNTNANWNTANANCTALGSGAHLVTIFDAAENTFVRNFIAGGEFWIGASDSATEGTFLWVTSEELTATFENWNGGEPNNNNGAEDCAEMRTDGLWNDSECPDGQRYMCERP